MKRASRTPWKAPTCTNCGGGLTRSACGALCRICIDDGVTLRPEVHLEPTDHLDGRKLSAWLYSHGLFNRQLQLGDRLAAKAASWAVGSKTVQVPIWDADEVLTKLDLHLSELPDEMWIERSPRTGRRRYCQEIKPEVLERHSNGETATELAAAYGIDHSTIWKWANTETREPLAA